MRIAVVEPVGRGGLVHYAFELCRGLAEEGEPEGVEVILITDRTYELTELHTRGLQGDRLPARRPHPGRRRDRPLQASGAPPVRVERLLRLWDAKPAEERGPGGLRRPLRRSFRRSFRRWARAVRWYRERLRLLRRLRRLRPDVVQLGDLRFASDLPFVLALRASGLRLGDVCHNVRPFDPAGGFGAGRLSRLLFRRIYRLFDAVFVHWEVNRRRFLETYGPIPGRLRAVPMGSPLLFRELRDPAVTAANLRARLGLGAAAGGAEAPVVLAFGTLAPYKGLDLLVEAFARLPAAADPVMQEARLVVAGFPLPGFDPEELRRLARRLGVEDRVHVVPGYVPSGEVAAWMELAAVAAFSHREVFQSGVLQVAAGFGVPVVASRVGATPEVVRDGETGLLVPPGDAGALAEALGRLLGDRSLARRLGAAAAEETRTRFAWRRVAREVLATYREILAAEAGP